MMNRSQVTRGSWSIRNTHAMIAMIDLPNLLSLPVDETGENSNVAYAATA